MAIESSSSESGRELILEGRLNGAQRSRLGHLLDMMYRPSEISSEVGFGRRQFYRVYIPAGCPHERDDRRHIWINGTAFRSWYVEIYKKHRMARDEAFCLTCKRPVKMANKTLHEKDGLEYWLCNCPLCGRSLARIVNLTKPVP